MSAVAERALPRPTHGRPPRGPCKGTRLARPRPSGCAPHHGHGAAAMARRWQRPAGLSRARRVDGEPLSTRPRRGLVLALAGRVRGQGPFRPRSARAHGTEKATSWPLLAKGPRARGQGRSPTHRSPPAPSRPTIVGPLTRRPGAPPPGMACQTLCRRASAPPAHAPPPRQCSSGCRPPACRPCHGTTWPGARDATATTGGSDAAQTASTRGGGGGARTRARGPVAVPDGGASAPRRRIKAPPSSPSPSPSRGAGGQSKSLTSPGGGARARGRAWRRIVRRARGEGAGGGLGREGTREFGGRGDAREFLGGGAATPEFGGQGAAARRRWLAGAEGEASRSIAKHAAQSLYK